MSRDPEQTQAPESEDAPTRGAPSGEAPGASPPDPEVAEEAPPAEDPERAALRERLAEAEQRLRDAEARLRAVSKAYREQTDEMASFRQRVEAQARLKEDRQAFDVVKNFFDPVQNLKRSLNAGIQDHESFLEGLRMVVHQFDLGLDKLGLAPVPGVGAPFDPNLHEALAVMPVAEPAMDGRVVMVHLDGFMVNGKVLQAAQVVIGKHQPEQVDEPEAPAPVEGEA